MARTRHTSDSDVLGELLCFDLYSVSRAMTRRYRPLLEQHRITYPQYLVLLVLGGEGPQSIKELAGTLRLDHATLTPMLRRLEEAGLVARDQDPEDARRVRLSLTERGARIHAGSDEIQCRLQEDLGLAPEEVRRLQTALRNIGDSMDRVVTAAD